MSQHNARNVNRYPYASTVLDIMNDVIYWQCAQMNYDGLQEFYIKSMQKYYSDISNAEEFNKDYKIYREHQGFNEEYLSAGS